MALVVRRTMVLVAALALGGCATWSTADVQAPSMAPSTVVASGICAYASRADNG